MAGGPSARRNLVVALVAGVFVALAVLGVTGGLGRDDQGPDPARQPDEQWNLALVGAPEAWTTTTGEGVVIAVVDSGVDSRHPDLRDRLVGSIDCVGADGDPDRCRPGGDTDTDGHGTHVAGIAVADADNGRGVAGVAPDARLLSVRALVPVRCERRPCGATGQAGDVAAGVRWAVAEGADVVNLSLGAAADGSDELVAAIDEADAAGVAVVAAGPSGRAGDDVIPSPAVIVTAVDQGRTLAPYARGTGSATTALAAPGGDERAPTDDGCDGDHAVRSDLPVPGGETDATGCLVGTSMAAPHVSGAIALLVASGLSPREAIERLVATATDLGARGPDDRYGAGLIDIPAALDDD
ncbi:MAG TPA: S8 family serine peptidase [Iamia sp.]|nr:S8 family serine peptidase [Iamia sp.]